MNMQRASAPLGGALFLVAIIGRWQDLLALVDLIRSLGLPDWAYILIGVIGFSLVIYGCWPKSAAQKAAEQHQWSEEALLQDARDRRTYHRDMFPYYLIALAIVAALILLMARMITYEDRPESPENMVKTLYRECLRDREGSPEACNPILQLEGRQ